MNEASYAVLKPQTLRGLPTNVTCYALNYITHQIMLCTKDDLFLYDLEKQEVIESLSYAKKFEKLYDSEVRIKSVDAIIMSGLWVTFVNKKSFLFFNDKLEFSRIYSAEPNPALSLQVVQRTNDIITLRGDRKMLKFWRFEFSETVDLEKMKRKSDKANEEDQPDKDKKTRGHFKKNDDKNEIDMEKHKAQMDKGQSFEMNLYSRRNISMAHNRLIMNTVFSEELNLIIVSMDNMEIAFYSLINCEHLQTLSFNTRPQTDTFNLPTLSLEQELLYYCDDQNFVVYDVLTNQEITNFAHSLSSKAVSIYAERSNPEGGIYIVTADEKLHVFSHSTREILWTEDIEGSNTTSHTTYTEGILRKGDASPTSPGKGVKYARSYSEYYKREFTFKEQFYKSQCNMVVDTNTLGLSSLFILAYGRFNIFKISTTGRVCLQTPKEILKMELKFAHEGDLKALTEFDTPRTQDNQLNIQLTFNDFKLSHRDIRSLTEVPKHGFDAMQLWRDTTYEPQPNLTSGNVNNMEVLQVYPIPEEKMLILLTRDFVHVVSLAFKRRMMQRISYTDVTACVAIRLSPDSLTKYYIVVGTAKGVIVIIECDFVLKQLVVLKNIIRHNQVVAMRYIKEVESLLSIGEDGNVFLFDAKNREKDSHMFFNLHQSHKLIWDQVSSIVFLNNFRILAGLGNGAVQYVKFNWKEHTKVGSELFKYHETPITHISATSQPIEQFLCSCEEGLISYWMLGQEAPIKVFRMIEPVQSLLLAKNPVEEKMELYVGLKNMILALDLTYGGRVTQVEYHEKALWTEAVATRLKHSTKTVRDGKTMGPLLSKGVETLKAIKNTKKYQNSGPMLFRYLFRADKTGCFKPLDSDFLRYILPDKSQQKKGHIWILDTILNEYFEKRIAGEPLVPKQEVKADKKMDGVPLLQNLDKALKKYPMIKAIMVEKFKEKEMIELHKNVVLLLNHVYQGEDTLEEQYKFLQSQYNFNLDDLDDKYFLRAKAMYAKKPIQPKSPPKVEVQPEPVPVKLPQIQQDLTPIKTQAILRSYYNPNGISSMKVTVPAHSFKNYNKRLEKELNRSSKPVHEIFRTLATKSSETKLAARRDPTRAYTSQKSQHPSLNFSHATFTPHGTTSNFFSLTAGSFMGNQNDSLAIGQNENTITAPSFTTSRSDFYRKRILVSEPRPKREPKKLDNTLTIEFPKRSNKNFVSTHSQGFSIKENKDLYLHVLRHILKNQHLFGRKDPEPRRREESRVSRNKDKDDEDIEYIPITVKQFILQTSKEQIALLDQIPNLYELKMGNTLLPDDPPVRSDYNLNDVEEQLEKENGFLEEVLEKINENGIEAVNLDNMIRFKKIVKRRMDIFSKLEDYIQASGVLQKEAQDTNQHIIKEDLIDTVQRIQEIRTSLGVDDIPKTVLFSNMPQLPSRQKSRPSLFQPKTPSSATETQQDFTHKILDTIFESVATFKQVNKELITGPEKTNPSTNPIAFLFNVPSDNSPLNDKKSTSQDLMSRFETDSPLKSMREDMKSLFYQGTLKEKGSEVSMANSPLRLYSFAGDSPNSKYSLKMKDTLGFNQSSDEFLANDPSANNIKRFSNGKSQQEYQLENTYDISPTNSKLAYSPSLKSPTENQNNLLELRAIKMKKNPNTKTSSGHLITPTLDNERRAAALKKFKTLRIDKDKAIEESSEYMNELGRPEVFSSSYTANMSTDVNRAKRLNTTQGVVADNSPMSFKSLGSALTPNVFTRSNDGINIGMIMKHNRHTLRSSTALLPKSHSYKTFKRSGTAEEKERPPIIEGSEINYVTSSQNIASDRDAEKLTDIIQDSVIENKEVEPSPLIKPAEEKVEASIMAETPPSTARISKRLENMTTEANLAPIEEKPLAEKKYVLPDHSQHKRLTTPGSIVGWKDKPDKTQPDEEVQKTLKSVIAKNAKRDVLVEEPGDYVVYEIKEKKGTSKESSSRSKKETQKKKGKTAPTQKSEKSEKVEKIEKNEKKEKGDKIEKFEKVEESPTNAKSLNDTSPLSTHSKKEKPNVQKNLLSINDASQTRPNGENSGTSRRTSSFIPNEEQSGFKGSRLMLSKHDSKNESKIDSKNESKIDSRNESKIEMKNESDVADKKNSFVPGRTLNFGAKSKGKGGMSLSKDLDSEDAARAGKISNLDAEAFTESPKPDSSGNPSKFDFKEEGETALKKAPSLTRKRTLSKKQRSSAELSPKGSESPLNKSHESPTFEGDKSLAASNSPDQQYALGTLQKIVELPQEDTLSARLKKKAGTVEEIIDQSLMKNPMTLFNHVIKEQDVDTQTKLDLYLYGSRKQALRDYIEQIESNVELNIMAQRDCQDQLKAMFDMGLNSLLTQKNLAFSNNLLAPSVNLQWEAEDKSTPQGKPRERGKSIISRVDEIDLTPEYSRKDAFIKQKEFISYLKRLEQRVVYEASNKVTLRNGKSKKKDVILGEEGIEALIYKGDVILNGDNHETQNKIENDLQNKSFEDKIKALYQMLEVMKARNPAGFMELVEAFHRNREYYESALQESKTRPLIV